MTTELPIKSIVVGERSRKDMGDLDTLVESIREHRLFSPIGVWRDGNTYRLAFGGRRLAACKQLGFDHIEARVLTSVTDVLQALEVERDENTCRKDLTISERVAEADAIEALIAAKAKERQRASGGVDPGSSKLDERASERRTDTQVAKAVGMGRSSLAKAKTVVAAATDESLPEPVRAIAVEAVAEMDRTGKVDGAHKKVELAKDWAWATTTYPFLAELPERHHAEFLAAARQLETMTNGEYDRRLDAFRKHVAFVVRGPADPEADKERRLHERCRRDVASLAVALGEVRRLTTSALDWPDALHDYPDVGIGWDAQITACRAALDELGTALRPTLRRIK